MSPETLPRTQAEPSEFSNRDTPERVFSTSVAVSGTRCFLFYVLFPWLLPALGVASGVGSGVGAVIGAIAIVFNVLSIRRFQRSRHRYRWLIISLNSAIIVLLVVLMVIDISHLLS